MFKDQTTLTCKDGAENLLNEGMLGKQHAVFTILADIEFVSAASKMGDVTEDYCRNLIFMKLGKLLGDRYKPLIFDNSRGTVYLIDIEEEDSRLLFIGGEDYQTEEVKSYSAAQIGYILAKNGGSRLGLRLILLNATNESTIMDREIIRFNPIGYRRELYPLSFIFNPYSSEFISFEVDTKEMKKGSKYWRKKSIW